MMIDDDASDYGNDENNTAVPTASVDDKHLMICLRSHVFELAVEGWQAEEAILAIFHPVLFHRTTGKFTYQVRTQRFK